MPLESYKSPVKYSRTRCHQVTELPSTESFANHPLVARVLVKEAPQPDTCRVVTEINTTSSGEYTADLVSP